MKRKTRTVLGLLLSAALLSACLPKVKKPSRPGMAAFQYPEELWLPAETSAESKPKVSRRLSAALRHSGGTEGAAGIREVFITDEYTFDAAFSGELSVPFLTSFAELMRSGGKLEPQIKLSGREVPSELWACSGFSRFHDMARMENPGPESRVKRRLDDMKGLSVREAENAAEERVVTEVRLSEISYADDVEAELPKLAVTIPADVPFLCCGFNQFITGEPEVTVSRSLQGKNDKIDNEAFLLFFKPEDASKITVKAVAGQNQTPLDSVKYSLHKQPAKLGDIVADELKQIWSDEITGRQGPGGHAYMPLLIRTIVQQYLPRNKDDCAALCAAGRYSLEEYLSEAANMKRIFRLNFTAELAAGETLTFTAPLKACRNYAGDTGREAVIFLGPAAHGLDFAETLLTLDESLRRAWAGCEIYTDEQSVSASFGAKSAAESSSYSAEAGAAPAQYTFAAKDNLSLIFHIR